MSQLCKQLAQITLVLPEKIHPHLRIFLISYFEIISRWAQSDPRIELFVLRWYLKLLQDAVNAATSLWSDLYTNAIIDGAGLFATGFNLLDSQSVYYDIIYNAVTCAAVSCDEPGVIADESAFRAAVMADLTVNSSVLSNSQTNAQSCVDNANGSPQIYKDIMIHYMTTVESPKEGFQMIAYCQ